MLALCWLLEGQGDFLRASGTEKFTTSAIGASGVLPGARSVPSEDTAATIGCHAGGGALPAAGRLLFCDLGLDGL
jgi:hypothetical protein